MMFPQSGGCQCGGVRYEISGPPKVVYACHCTECQRQSGAAFAMATVIPKENFRITKGEPNPTSGLTAALSDGAIEHRMFWAFSGDTILRGRFLWSPIPASLRAIRIWLGGLALSAKPSVDSSEYWQRHEMKEAAN
jgi:hypothetical protein